ncbi:hypothetical protein J2X76_002484 [Neorhizobium sp. 2083]|uniref:hypothetical protein n=1 Tax=Neorhizobium sp. 2083 TaxID=2817762 RepID=UPI000DDFD359|nr:hypothetical protein [Neorhizobium sp. 2083]MDR6817311.1 hypothetical protein [Neorhizobium sp. 2083]
MNAAVLTHAFEPSELAFLQRLFDDICAERGLPTGGPVASTLAAQIIQLYQQGVRDPRELQDHLAADAHLKT